MLETPEISSVFLPTEAVLPCNWPCTTSHFTTQLEPGKISRGFTAALYNKYFLISTGNAFIIWPPSQCEVVCFCFCFFWGGGVCGAEVGHNSGNSSSLCYWLIYRNPLIPPSFSAGKHSVYRGNPFQQDCSVWSCTLCYRTSFHLLLKSSRSLSKFH